MLAPMRQMILYKITQLLLHTGLWNVSSCNDINFIMCYIYGSFQRLCQHRTIRISKHLSACSKLTAHLLKSIFSFTEVIKMSKQICEKQLMKQSTNEWDKSWGIWSKCWLAYWIKYFPEKAQEQDLPSQTLILEWFDKAGFLHSLPSMFSLPKSLGKVIYF